MHRYAYLHLHRVRSHIWSWVQAGSHQGAIQLLSHEGLHHVKCLLRMRQGANQLLWNWYLELRLFIGASGVGSYDFLFAVNLVAFRKLLVGLSGRLGNRVPRQANQDHTHGPFYAPGLRRWPGWGGHATQVSYWC